MSLIKTRCLGLLLATILFGCGNQIESFVTPKSGSDPDPAPSSKIKSIGTTVSIGSNQSQGKAVASSLSLALGSANLQGQQVQSSISIKPMGEGQVE